MEIYFLCGYILALFIQIFFHIFASLALHRAKKQAQEAEKQPKTAEKGQKLPSVSLVICARNERDNLKNHLPNLLYQQYKGEWEIIVVDDDSFDNSLEILAHFERQYPQKLRVIGLKDKQKAGKKVALQAGINAAKGEWILLTDADCCPNSFNWLGLMIGKAMENPQTEIVLGFSPYREKNTILSAWIGYETALTGLQYISFAQWGKAYMGVGRNLLYKKSLFLEKNNFKNHQIASGDDDLFINEASNSTNTQVCLDKNSFCKSQPVGSWKGLYWQKKRHFAAGNFYPTSVKIYLFLIAQSHFWAHIGCLLWIIFDGINPLILTFWAIRNIVVWGLMAYISKFIFHYKKNLLLFAFFDLVVPIYYCIFAATFTKNQKRIQWK